MRATLIFFTLAFGHPSAAESICPPCPDGHKEVAITFASSMNGLDQEWEQKLRRSAWHYWRRPAGVHNEGVRLVHNVTELRNGFAELAKQCKRIRFLGLHSHGAVGKLGFDGTSSPKNPSPIFNGQSLFIQGPPSQFEAPSG